MEATSHPAVHPVAVPPQFQGAGPPAIRMKDFPGSPGTAGGLALRFTQFGFSLISLCIMVSIAGFSSVTAFWCESFLALKLQIYQLFLSNGVL